MNGLTEDETKLAERARKVWDEAVETYQLPKSVKFTLMFSSSLQMRVHMGRRKGRGLTPVGLAIFVYSSKKATVILNRDAIKQNIQDMLDDTIPHEIAHIVCDIKPYLGSKHNEGWQEVCKRLGGTGKSTYIDEYDMRLRKHKRHDYRLPKYGVITLGPQYHARVQKGRVYTIRPTGEIITPAHYVGVHSE